MRSHSIKAVLCSFLCLLLAGCGASEVERVASPNDTLVTYEPDTTGMIPLESFSEVWERRVANGDTVAISHDILKKCITSTIDGYVLESDQATTFTTQNFTFSEASKVFYNQEEDFIEVVAGDYVANPDFIEVQLRRFNLAQDVEIQGVTDRKVDLTPVGEAGQFFAWASYNPVKQLALVNVGVNYRYIISISMTGAKGIPENETIERWLNLSELPG